MLLYLLLEVELGIPQLLCKTPLKTNPEVHYHGVDGVHGKVTDTGGRPDGATEDAEYSGADTRRQASG
jgi:Cap4 SAVED domain